MTKALLIGLSGFLALTLMMSAADVSGKWVAQVPGRGGETREMTFTFKVDGETLTGTVGSARGETAISEGKVNGDNISFSVTRQAGGNPMKMLYKGVVSGNEIKFTSQREGSDRTREFTAKKVS